MQAGDYFAEKYLIEGILGRGGMGTVYLARNIKTGMHWAIKEINRESGNDTCMPPEPYLLNRLDHPALPKLYDMVEQDGKLYMITDFIDGISLDKKLEAEGRIAEDTVTDWAIQLCTVLGYLHSAKPNPIIYRDIKPSNIMLTSSGMLKLIDFGTAREYKPMSDADTVYIGTRGYAAPEQFGTGQTSAASDIYSLGVTLHHLVTGKSPVEPPFKIEPIRCYDESLSPELEAIIAKCTCESAADRYQSADELLEDLDALRCRQGTIPYQYADRRLCGSGEGFRPSCRNSSKGSGLDSPGECKPHAELKQDYDRKPRESLEPVGCRAVHEHLNPRELHAQKEPCRPLHMESYADSRHCHHAEASGSGSGSSPEIQNAGPVPGNEYQENVPQTHSFRRMVITVWDNAEFGCELAYTAAKLTGSEVLLADLDLLAPKADLILNVCKYPPQLARYDIPGYSGLDIVMDAADKRILTSALLKRAAAVRKDMKNLHIITGNYRLDNYEYYSEESVTYFIDKCYRHFDITVLLVNRSIYDAFTLAALLRSDVNIAAIRGEISQLREFNTYIAFLNEKQHLPPENTKFVLFEFDRSTDIGKGEAIRATQDNLLGTVSFSRKRVLYRNMKSAYVCHMEKEILKDYSRIHKKLGFMPAAAAMPGLKMFGCLAGGMKSRKSRPSEG